jgi:DNA-binding response OmpR family regulator
MDRHVPLVVIGSLSSTLADSVAQQLRRDGKVVYVTHSAEGCLRVATSVHADVILLDPAFPSRLEKLLRAHPFSAGARILHLTQDAVRPGAIVRPAAA